MAREIHWTDSEEIGILLQEKHPEIEPYSVRFTDLHKYVTELPGWSGSDVETKSGCGRRRRRVNYDPRCSNAIPSPRGRRPG